MLHRELSHKLIDVSEILNASNIHLPDDGSSKKEAKAVPLHEMEALWG
jgi:hypothetical protein